MTAARTGKVEAVKALLAHGADVNAKESRRGQTALMWAAAEGNVEVVEALIQAGADLHARLDSGFTPFLFAVREGRIGVVRALLKAGADVNETIQPPPLPDEESAGIHGAPARGHQRPAPGGRQRALSNWPPSCSMPAPIPNAAGPGYTALHVDHLGPQARRRRQRSRAGRLRQHDQPASWSRSWWSKGANLNARMTRKVNFGLTSLNTMGATPFLLAAKTADAELMRFLAKLGADPLHPERRQRHAADGGRGTRHALSRRGCRHRERSGGGAASRARSRQRSECGRQERRDRHARRRLQESAGRGAIPGRPRRQDRRSGIRRTSRAGRR